METAIDLTSQGDVSYSQLHGAKRLRSAGHPHVENASQRPTPNDRSRAAKKKRGVERCQDDTKPALVSLGSSA